MDTLEGSPMRRTRYFPTTVLALLMGGAMLASPAGAAQLLTISWDVTGGTFNADGASISSNGPITGGHVELVLGHEPKTYYTGGTHYVTPPFVTPFTGGALATLRVTLTGPSGYVHGTVTRDVNSLGVPVTVTPLLAKLGLLFWPNGAPYLQSGTRDVTTFTPMPPLLGMMASSGVGSGALAWATPGTTGIARHQFTIGNEVRTVEGIPVAIDIKPGSDPNSINPNASGDVAVAILGSDTFDVADIDATTLAFGPPGEPGAPIEHANGPHLEDKPNHPYDVNEDGFADALAHFVIAETGIMAGDTEACVTGELGGQSFEGCDAIRTEVACGLGVELVLLLPPLAWQYRRRRIRSAR
jgi:hypothetical protein